MRNYGTVFMFILLILGTIIILYKVFHRPDDLLPPHRPKKVPFDAVWTGGVDGGDWIQCKNIIDHLYECHIFSDWDGTKISSGQYCLEGNIEKGDITFRMYDGEIIYIKGGRLIPTGDIIYYHGDSGKETQVIKYPEKTCTSKE